MLPSLSPARRPVHRWSLPRCSLPRSRRLALIISSSWRAWLPREGVVRVMALTAGQPAWSVDALRGVAWAPDAELKLAAGGRRGGPRLARPSRGKDGGDAAWSWGRTASRAASRSPWGRGRAPPPRASRGSSLAAAAPFTRALAGGTKPRPTTSRRSLPIGRRRSCAAITTPTCWARATTISAATAFSPAEGVARPSVVAIRDRDFGDDDEREHEAFTVGDDLGIVRVGGAGTLSMRDLSSGHASPWRRLKRALSEDDDVVAVDGDAASTIVVFTRDAADACGGGESGAQTVRALRIDRQTGDEALLALATADCDSTPGSVLDRECPRRVGRGVEPPEGAAGVHRRSNRQPRLPGPSGGPSRARVTWTSRPTLCPTPDATTPAALRRR